MSDLNTKLRYDAEQALGVARQRIRELEENIAERPSAGLRAAAKELLRTLNKMQDWDGTRIGEAIDKLEAALAALPGAPPEQAGRPAVTAQADALSRPSGPHSPVSQSGGLATEPVSPAVLPNPKGTSWPDVDGASSAALPPVVSGEPSEQPTWDEYVEAAVESCMEAAEEDDRSIPPEAWSLNYGTIKENAERKAAERVERGGAQP